MEITKKILVVVIVLLTNVLLGLSQATRVPDATYNANLDNDIGWASFGRGGFNPSTTSYYDIVLDKEVQITASTNPYSAGEATYRRVVVSRAQNGVWDPASRVELKGKLSNGTFITNSDQAQVIAFGTRMIACVMRAWNFLGQAGAADHEQPGSIYPSSYIFYSISTDGGLTWGYYDNSNVFQPGEWCLLDQGSNNDPLMTVVDFPSIAFRNEFDTKGYITWERKVYSKSGSNFSVQSSTLALGVFDGSTGKIIPTSTGNQQILSISTGSGYKGPERPSIAVAPDGFWIGYYSTKYDAGNTTKYQAVKGASTVTSGNVFTTVDANGTTIGSGVLAGTYDQTRGHFYASDLVSPSNTSYFVDLATGPSIQVAVEYPQTCCSYQLGYVFSSQNGSLSGRKRKLSFFHANMNCGDLASDFATKAQSNGVNNVETINSSLDEMWVFPSLKYTYVDEPLFSQRLLDDEPEAKSAAFTRTGDVSRSYFALSFMYLYRETSDANSILRDARCRTALSFNNSNFEIVEHSTTPTTHTYIENTDGGNGTNSSYDATWWGMKTDVCPGYGKLSISGTTLQEVGNFTVHPVWHSIALNSTNPKLLEKLMTNKGGAILALPYLEDFPATNPESFPDKLGMIGTSSFSTTYAPYAFFSFNFALLSPGSLSAVSTYSDPNTPNFYGSYSLDNSFWSSFGAKFGASSILLRQYDRTPGIYYFGYKGTRAVQGGLLAWSDQRKIVLTGAVAHAVFEKGDKVYYTVSIRRHSSTDPDELVWSQPMEIGLENGSHSGVESKPSIAVYQNGENGFYNYLGRVGQQGFNGETSIAVTWVERKTGESNRQNRYAIKLRTREFNVCTGEWSTWSPIYEIHSHIYNAFEGTQFSELPVDTTRPVLAPLVSPTNSSLPTSPVSDDLGGQNGVPTKLIGWNIVWTGPKLVSLRSDNVAEFNAITGNTISPFEPTGLYSRNWLRADAPTTSVNSNWGQYPIASSALLVPNSSTVKANDLFINPKLGTDIFGSMLFENPSFPSVTSLENKFRVNPDPTTGLSLNYGHMVAFSHDGYDPNNTSVTFTDNSISVLLANYKKDGSNVGELIYAAPQKVTPRGVLKSPDLFERNPSIVANSSGQPFIAWEVLKQYKPSPDKPFKIKGAIRIASLPLNWSNSVNFNTTNPALFWRRTFNPIKELQTNLFPIHSIIKTDYSFRNASLSSFPKARATNVWSLGRDARLTANLPYGVVDQDIGSVELSFWRRLPDGSETNDNAGSLMRDYIYHVRYFEEPRNEGSPLTEYGMKLGDWLWIPYSSRHGSWIQRSFSPRQGGPMPGQFVNRPYFSIEAWNEMSPSFTKSTVQDLNYFDMNIIHSTMPIIPHVLKGTYDTNCQSVHYREERWLKDSASISYLWGGIYVGDTTSSLPLRQVILAAEYPDNGFETALAQRDTFFRTEVFDWPTGTDITFSRGVYYSDTSAIVFGGCLADPSFQMAYTVELVFEDGTIDTVETVVFSPGNNKFVIPKKVTITNGGLTRNVFLRVRADLSGYSFPDSLATFVLVQKDTTDDMEADTSFVANKIGKGLLRPKQGILDVLDLFPHPVRPSSATNLLFSLDKEVIYSIKMLDILGRTMFENKNLTSIGGWQKVLIQSPAQSGTYILQITAAGEIRNIPFIVK